MAACVLSYTFLMPVEIVDSEDNVKEDEKRFSRWPLCITVKECTGVAAFDSVMRQAKQILGCNSIMAIS